MVKTKIKFIHINVLTLLLRLIGLNKWGIDTRIWNTMTSHELKNPELIGHCAQKSDAQCNKGCKVLSHQNYHGDNVSSLRSQEP
jgi:hypothetical protein